VQLARDWHMYMREVPEVLHTFSLNVATFFFSDIDDNAVVPTPSSSSSSSSSSSASENGDVFTTPEEDGLPLPAPSTASSSTSSSSSSDAALAVAAAACGSGVSPADVEAKELKEEVKAAAVRKRAPRFQVCVNSLCADGGMPFFSKVVVPSYEALRVSHLAFPEVKVTTGLTKHLESAFRVDIMKPTARSEETRFASVDDAGVLQPVVPTEGKTEEMSYFAVVEGLKTGRGTAFV
jgi:hypothetical protein